MSDPKASETDLAPEDLDKVAGGGGHTGTTDGGHGTITDGGHGKIVDGGGGHLTN
jgi:hypothetical protein